MPIIPTTQPTLPALRTALHAFAQSSSAFQVLLSIPSSPSTPLSNQQPLPARTLYILDSSFNPPTRAHLRLAVSALLNDTHGHSPKRLLLLLATQNADKPSVPAPLEHRLAMMSILGEEVRGVWKKEREKKTGRRKEEEEEDEEEVPAVDIGLTKYPYFIDKSRAIEESGVYTTITTGDKTSNSTQTEPQTQTEQIHIIGYDTLIRLLDTKYYPPTNTLTPLSDLFVKHRLRVMYRVDASSNPVELKKQKAYLSALANGDREHEDGKREWADRIEMVLPEEETVGVSSTVVRKLIKEGKEGQDLEKWVTPGVGTWIEREGLYRE